jgi:hypothetical protein
MANVNASITRLYPTANPDSSGVKVGYISGVTKASASDTVTLSNASEIIYASITDDTAGDTDPVTTSTNIITLTGTNTGTVSGIVIYK